MTSILFKIVRICYSQFKCNYLKNAKHFLDFLFLLLNLQQIWNILKSKTLVIGNVFPKLQTVKTFLRPFCKKRRFGTHFKSQHVKVSPILGKCPWEHFYQVFPSLWGRLIWKISPLVVGEFFWGFVDTLSANGRYHVQDWENFSLRIPMKLYEKWKTFSEFFVPFLETTSNFKHFEKKDSGHS